MLGFQRRNEIDNLVRRNRAHDSELERNPLHFGQILRHPLRIRGRVVNHFQMRPNYLPQFGKVGIFPLAAKQVAAELGFQRLDCARKRGLRYVAPPGSAREIQLLRNGKEIPDLMHLHDEPTFSEASGMKGTRRQGSPEA